MSNIEQRSGEPEGDSFNKYAEKYAENLDPDAIVWPDPERKWKKKSTALEVTPYL